MFLPAFNTLVLWHKQRMHRLYQKHVSSEKYDVISCFLSKHTLILEDSFLHLSLSLNLSFSSLLFSSRVEFVFTHLSYDDDSVVDFSFNPLEFRRLYSFFPKTCFLVVFFSSLDICVFIHFPFASITRLVFRALQ